jgi:hypothetical protein
MGMDWVLVGRDAECAELRRALRDGGRLAFRDGVVALAGADAALIPDGIREAVLLRATRLAELGTLPPEATTR